MKKLLAFALLVTCISCTTVMAQPGRGRGNFAEMREKQKTQLKTELQLTDAQADTVMAINMESLMKMRGFRELSQEEKIEKAKEVNEARNKRLASALKDEALTKKVIAFYEKQRKERMQNAQNGGALGNAPAPAGN